MNTSTAVAFAALVLSTTAASAQRIDLYGPTGQYQGQGVIYGQKTYPVGPQLAPRPDVYRPYSTVQPYSPDPMGPSRNFGQSINRPFGQ